MMTENGTLPIGVEYEGKMHCKFQVRPMLARDTISLMVGQPEKVQDKAYLLAAGIAKQIVRLGDIPADKITAEMVMEMYGEDYIALSEAIGRLRERLRSFRDVNEAPQDAGAGTEAHGL